MVKIAHGPVYVIIGRQNGGFFSNNSRYTKFRKEDDWSSVWVTSRVTRLGVCYGHKIRLWLGLRFHLLILTLDVLVV